jgi:hypothetical protein
MSEQVDYASKIPKSLYETYNRLYEEIVWLHLRWNSFLILYGKNPETVNLLNRTAMSFFRMHQDTLYESILLTIGTPTDSGQMGKKGNLSLERLVRQRHLLRQRHLAIKALPFQMTGRGGHGHTDARQPHQQLARGI